MSSPDTTSSGHMPDHKDEADLTESFISIANGGYSKYKEAELGTDLILKSCDDIKFHVHTLILSLSSSVFKDMFDMPHTTSTKEPVELSESGQVLLLLLDIIYPGRGLL